MTLQQLEAGLEFAGLAVLANPLKHDTASTIRQLQAAAVRAVMVTGDHAQTGISVARQCGILGDGRPVAIISGREGAPAATSPSCVIVQPDGRRAQLELPEAVKQLAEVGAAEFCSLPKAGFRAGHAWQQTPQVLGCAVAGRRDPVRQLGTSDGHGVSSKTWQSIGAAGCQIVEAEQLCTIACALDMPATAVLLDIWLTHGRPVHAYSTAYLRQQKAHPAEVCMGTSLSKSCANICPFQHLPVPAGRHRLCSDGQGLCSPAGYSRPGRPACSPAACRGLCSHGPSRQAAAGGAAGGGL